MYPTGAITTAGTQQQAPIYGFFTLLKQDVKNFLVSSSIVTIKDEAPKIGGTLALLDFANLAEKNKWKGPTDLAANHDKYFFEAWKEELADKKQNAK